MKHSTIYILLAVSCWLLAGTVQAQDEDYKAFRDKVFSEYSQFRKKVLSDYDKFLAGVWDEFKAFKGEQRDKKPKPTTPPVCEDPTINDPVQLTPDPETIPEQLPVSPLDPVQPTIPTVTPPDFVVPNITRPDLNNPGLTAQKVVFEYCGISHSFPLIDVPSISSMGSSDVSSAWKSLDTNKTRSLISTFKAYQTEYGLNDWLTFKFVQAYTNALANESSCSERVLIEQYIMANLGYDVRLAKSERQLLLLIPLKEMMYAVSYLSIDNSRFYIFTDELSPAGEGDDMKIYTTKLPKNASLGKQLSLVFTKPVNINSGESHNYNISHGGITVSGTIDTNVMELLRHYPQTDIEVYAKSNILPDVRRQVVEQIKPCLAGKSELEQVNILLHFVQEGFAYAADDKFHGYEKYYFFEEDLFYPKNDCEDRAIFFGYLVKHLLGLDVQLLGYPEHESSAVSFTSTDIKGDYYLCNGRRFVISDPTYIGADAGMCMSRYKQTNPKIDYTF